MTAWTGRLERIAVEASQLSPQRVLVTIVTAPFFLLGWIIGLLWMVGALVWSAAWVGVREGRGLKVRAPD